MITFGPAYSRSCKDLATNHAHKIRVDRLAAPECIVQTSFRLVPVSLSKGVKHARACRRRRSSRSLSNSAVALRRAGYAVDHAVDGERADVLGNDERYDAVVLD